MISGQYGRKDSSGPHVDSVSHSLRVQQLPGWTRRRCLQCQRLCMTVVPVVPKALHDHRVNGLTVVSIYAKQFLVCRVQVLGLIRLPIWGGGVAAPFTSGPSRGFSYTQVHRYQMIQTQCQRVVVTQRKQWSKQVGLCVCPTHISSPHHRSPRILLQLRSCSCGICHLLIEK